MLQIIVSGVLSLACDHPNTDPLEEYHQTNSRKMLLPQIIVIGGLGLASADVFTDPAVFERLCHFKNDGVVSFHTIQYVRNTRVIKITWSQVNHLNPVDEAMIADASCRLVAGELNFSYFLLVKCFLHIICIN